MSSSDSSGCYLEFWRTETWDEHHAELKKKPEAWEQIMLEFCALLYDQLDCPEDLSKDETLAIVDESLQLAIEYLKEDWKWVGAMLVSSVDSVGFADSDIEDGVDGDEPIGPPKWLITEGTGLSEEELRNNFLMNKGRLKCEFRGPLYNWLRTKSDVLGCEKIGGEIVDTDSSDQETPVPVQLPSFAEMIGGEEGFYVMFSGVRQTYRDRDYRVFKFRALAGSQFPHLFGNYGGL